MGVILKFIDKDLIKYCEDNKFPIEEMTFTEFKRIENTLSYNLYKLGKLAKVMYDTLETSRKKIEHRKKSCKNFKVK